MHFEIIHIYHTQTYNDDYYNTIISLMMVFY